MDSQVYEILQKELNRQRTHLELIASENYTSQAVLNAMGSCLSNKYAEGYPGKRYYGGCEFVDEGERLAIERLKELFGAAYANVQPHSGSQANAAVFLMCLKPGDTILGFDLSHGGHLTHGSPVNFSGKTYNASFYGVEEDSGLIDMNKVRDKALAVRPKMIICGASAYSRDWDYKRFREIADEVGAILLADIAHPSGLIAKGMLNDPLPHCHVVTSTTHKTLRGPRGGIIMMGKDYENPMGLTTRKGKVRKMSSVMDSGVFPGTQGGPLEHVILAKAQAFGEALSDEFRDYTEQVIRNAKTMASGLTERGYKIISGGTDNHLMLIDLRNKGVSGKRAEAIMGDAGITVNKNMVPYDDKSPMVTSGIRIGTAAITTLGMKEDECLQIVDWIDEVISNPENPKIHHGVSGKVSNLMSQFPLYPELVVQ